MKKRKTITTQKREIWIIREDEPDSRVPEPTSTEGLESNEPALGPTEQSSTATDPRPPFKVF